MTKLDMGRYVITVAAILSWLLVREAKADFTSGNDLWDACAADERYDFWLTAAPLRVTGAVGAPLNPIAVR